MEYLGDTLLIFSGIIFICVLCSCIIREVRKTLDLVVMGVGMSV